MERQCDTPHPGLFFPVDGCSDKPNLGLSSVAVCCEETHLERSGDWLHMSHQSLARDYCRLSFWIIVPLSLLGLCLFGGWLGKRFTSQL